MAGAPGGRRGRRACSWRWRCTPPAFEDCRDVASLFERHTEEEQERESPHKGVNSKLTETQYAPRQLLLLLLPAAAPGRPARQYFILSFVSDVLRQPAENKGTMKQWVCRC